MSYQRGRGQGRGGRGYGGGRGNSSNKPGNNRLRSLQNINSSNIDEGELFKSKMEIEKQEDDREHNLGYKLFSEGPDRLGWLITFYPTQIEEQEGGQICSAMNCYFIQEDGNMFKAKVAFSPYFYLQIQNEADLDVDGYLRRKFEGKIKNIEVVQREDLDLRNHLSGITRTLLKISFWNSQFLQDVKRELNESISKNQKRAKTTDAYSILQEGNDSRQIGIKDVVDFIEDIKEHDVQYSHRFAIDMDIRCGHWYLVKVKGEGCVTVTRQQDKVLWAEPRVCAFDIETTKRELMFPDAEEDQIFMISYMLDKQGYLIVNREVVSADIDDFEFQPKPEFEGPFSIFNVANEFELLQTWFNHMKEVNPAIYVTYNGDWFDWPFIENRVKKYGMSMYRELGFRIGKQAQECLSRYAVHMDCLYWVNRDSYLPQGSRGLKAVCKAKLGYDPVEVDPEDMLPLAKSDPQRMAEYSVSDAVATYYLYMTYIHPFIFSLASIIPMPPDEVLRKGSGTLCEMLLMVQAYEGNIICPNKHKEDREKFYKGHLLKSETYIGGKVEAIESGVFRADFKYKFNCQSQGYQKLLDELDSDLEYAISVEGGMKKEDLTNYEEVRDQIKNALEDLRDNPVRDDFPLIYHLDVAAMYPNIILTNRLQPSAIVSQEDCAACDFNRPTKNCLRKMEWVWRGEHYALDKNEYLQLKSTIQTEKQPSTDPEEPHKYFSDLTRADQDKLLLERVKTYTQKVYARCVDKAVEQKKIAGICMRENSFYVDTVQAFRDRRYEYKGLTKKWKNELSKANLEQNALEITKAKDMIVLYDSLQLAHKCILNSFYGYVMRKGARWYSMEMAGVVTHTGAIIIQRACELVNKIGRPLELDTDGIWCALPKSFPENYKFKNVNGKDLKISYPCVILNVMVARNNVNNQYQKLIGNKQYEISDRMTIQFEVDGPYKAMILPASKEEGKSIKKRYAVFEFDGTLVELKGFEIKRRGELKLIKMFQQEIFEQFLEGETLEECYQAVAGIANRWLDMLDTKGEDLSVSELLEYLSESCTMSKSMDEYGERKSCAITTAQRLCEFLKGDKGLQDKGLKCQYFVAKQPCGKPTSARAVPVTIFQADSQVAKHYLRKWCGDIQIVNQYDELDPRDIIDWDYYRERLGGAIQKIITIPAALQQISNPVPRVKHPDWLHKQIRAKNDRYKQQTLDRFFQQRNVQKQQKQQQQGDIEDLANPAMQNVENLMQIDDEGTVIQQQNENDENQIHQVGIHNKRNRENSPQQHKCPNIKEDYQGWLQHKKRQWIQDHNQRKKQKVELQRREKIEVLQQQAGNKSTVLTDALNNRQIESEYIQIIQILQGENDSEYVRAWVVKGSRLELISLRQSQKKFYVSCSQQLDFEEAECQVVKKYLPEGQELEEVYEVQMGHKDFEWRLNELQLSGADVESVEEHSIPLNIEAQLQLSCVVLPNIPVNDVTLLQGFQLEQLESKLNLNNKYLFDDRDECWPLQPIYICHSGDCEKQNLFSMVVPSQKSVVLSIQCQDVTVKEVSRGAAHNLWEQGVASASKRQNISLQQQQLLNEFTTKIYYNSDLEDAAYVLDEVVQSVKGRSSGVMIILQAGDSDWLKSQLASLGRCPVVEVAGFLGDNKYPGLGWQSFASKRAIKRLISMMPALKQRIAIARYASVPICNIAKDWKQYVSDILYGRKLRDGNQLLWIETCNSSVDQFCRKRLPQDYEDEEINSRVVLNQQGMYRCMCVKICIEHLIVCALEKTVQLGELEQSDLLQGEFTGSEAFQLLRKLVLRWLYLAEQQSCWVSDELLQYLYVWISNRQGMLYSPAIHAGVHFIIKKLMAQLIKIFRNVGGQVVHANCDYIIVSTGKTHLEAAKGYVECLLQSLQACDLFQHLLVQVKQYWGSLLWKDEHNYMGVTVDANVTSSGMEFNDLVVEGVDTEKPNFIYQSSISKFLHGELSEQLLYFMQQYCWIPLKFALERSVQGETQQQLVDIQTSYLKQVFTDEFREPILSIVEEVARKSKYIQLPNMPGSVWINSIDQQNAATIFVTCLCEMLALDQTMQDEVATLKKLLLKIINVGEYSKKSEYVHPCNSYVVRDIVCTYCRMCVDLDLCQDDRILEGKWSCQSCLQDFDMFYIESRIIEDAEIKIFNYLGQDYKCGKCNRSYGCYMGFSCENCGHSLQQTMPQSRIQSQLELLKQIATYHNFEVLALALEQFVVA